mmetsp:Transcript_29479/g.50182  ORF Transcript_29479/g.50182 Transcript_29479/m.50182 type:complete len:126 (+) Transcript_29479:255-632(+)
MEEGLWIFNVGMQLSNAGRAQQNLITSSIVRQLVCDLHNEDATMAMADTSWLSNPKEFVGIADLLSLSRVCFCYCHAKILMHKYSMDLTIGNDGWSIFHNTRQCDVVTEPMTAGMRIDYLLFERL